MTEKDLIHIREELRRLTVLAEGWGADGITTLERDLALEKLRGLYDAVCFASCGETQSVEIPVEDEIPLSINLDEVLLSVIPVVEELSEPEPAVSVSEPEPALEIVVTEASVPEVEEQPEILIVEPLAFAQAPVKQMEQALFGMEEIEQHKRKQRVIMSLYDDAPVAVNILSATASFPAPDLAKDTQEYPDVTQSPVPAPEFEPAGETEPESVPETGSDSEIIYAAPAPETTGAVLGEVINRGVQTLGETLTAPRNTISEAAHMAHVDDLRAAIGINDRFLLVRDLFGGDAAACDAAIDELNSLDDLDDCMIYIAEHYAWNPNSDGAKLLAELLERKHI